MKPGPVGTPAEILERLATERNVSLAALTRMLRRGEGYLATFVRTGQPKRLVERDRALLAAYFQVPAWWFEEDAT